MYVSVCPTKGLAGDNYYLSTDKWIEICRAFNTRSSNNVSRIPQCVLNGFLARFNWGKIFQLSFFIGIFDR